MSEDTFEAPSLEILASALPAYEFEAFIAQGGMGAVYKARQRSLDRSVAIKILPREFGEDPEFRQSFETEAKAMARLNHPNLIGVYDYGDVDGMPYIVMEFVNGKSLFHSAYNLQVDPLQAVTIVKGICDGLAHAHENGVIHRDIKPANILLNDKVVPKIGDFGLARPMDAHGSGLVMGTPGYVAPELLRHPEHADRRSDLFALGVVLYELLIGRCPPFGDHQPPASVVCGCDVSLDRICEKAMHPVAELRYQSAEAMSADLDAWLRHGAAPAHAAHGAAGPRRPAAPPRAAGAAVYHAPERSSSSGAVKGLLMLAAAIVLAAIAWPMLSGGGKDDKPSVQNDPAGGGKGTPTAPGDPGNTGSKPIADPQKGAGTSTPTLSPLESLARLKSDLVAGKRDAMPEGAVSLGGTHVMVIPTALTWQAAQSFAAKHGAHLFIPEHDSQLDQVAKLMPAAEGGADAGLWIGAGSVTGQDWSWVDGGAWHLTAKPEGKGSHLILGERGALKAREAGDRYPFAIQWQDDGSNPTDPALVLDRAGESFAKGKPLLPPGTLSYGDRFIYVAHSSNIGYEQARELAKQAHGDLATLDTAEKARWLGERLPAEEAKDGYWVGGHREDDKWLWVDGKPFDHTQWADDAQATNHGGTLKVAANGQWFSGSSGDPAAGFIIEWGGGGSGGSGSGGGATAGGSSMTGEAPAAVAELDSKAKELLGNLAKERDKELAANAKTFAWEIDNWHKDLAKNENAAWTGDVTALKGLVANNRVPSSVDASSGIRLSAALAKICERCLEKQKTIDASYQSKADKLRSSYATRMGDAAKKLAKEGNAQGAKFAEARAAKAAVLNDWMEMITGEAPAPAQDAPAAASAGASFQGSNGPAGRWVWRSRDIITIDDDGKVEGERRHDGTWKRSEGEKVRYEFTWEESKRTDKLTLSADGMELSGLDDKGDKITAWRIVQGKDPLVDAWAWMPGYCVFRDDFTVQKGNDRGTWSLTSSEGRTRSYAVKWTSGFVDNISLEGNADSFTGTNNKGDKLTGKRVPKS